MRMRTSIRAARARIIGAIFVTIAHQIRAFCLPVSFRPSRDFLPIGFHPLPRNFLHGSIRAVFVGARREGPP